MLVADIPPVFSILSAGFFDLILSNPTFSITTTGSEEFSGAATYDGWYKRRDYRCDECKEWP